MKTIYFGAIIFVTILFYGCNGGNIFSKSNLFIGEWKIVPKSETEIANLKANGIKNLDVTIKISKQETSYRVEYWIKDKEYLSNNKTIDTTYELFSLMSDNSPQGKYLTESLHKYELSDDKKFLINNTLSEPRILEYNAEDNALKDMQFGWFKKN